MEAVLRSTVSAHDKLLLIVLADYANADGEQIYPSVATMAARASLSVRAVQYGLRRLEASGLLACVEEGSAFQRPRRYQIQVNALTPVQTVHPPGATHCTPPVQPAAPPPVQPTAPDPSLGTVSRTVKDTTTLSAAPTAPRLEVVGKGLLQAQRAYVAKALLEELNEQSGYAYKPVPSNLGLIEGLLRAGYHPEHIGRVITHQCALWRRTDQRIYLRPKTLFGPINFANYAGQVRQDHLGPWPYPPAMWRECLDGEHAETTEATA
jgi:uncharacterized phage protein (TIGR02220 family)